MKMKFKKITSLLGFKPHFSHSKGQYSTTISLWLENIPQILNLEH